MNTTVMTTDFVYVLVLLTVGFSVLWILCRIFGVKRLGVPELGAIVLAFGMSYFDYAALLWAIIPFLLGFISGRSTRVLLDPTDVTSPGVRLPDEEYAYRAEQYKLIMQSPEVQQYFLSPCHAPTEKLTLLFEGQGFGLYRHARILALLTSLFYITIWSTANQFHNTELYVLVCMLSLPFGYTIGLLWKYIRGHPGSREGDIGGDPCKPTFRSFMISFLYDCSPAIMAAIVTYFLHGKIGNWVVLLDVLAGLFCIFLLIQTILVHLRKFSLFEEGIVISGIGRPRGFRWEDFEKAVVRERHNLLSGTDKLLILYFKQGGSIAYPVSVLSKRCENEVLREVRRRVPTSSIFDNPSF